MTSRRWTGGVIGAVLALTIAVGPPSASLAGTPSPSILASARPAATSASADPAASPMPATSAQPSTPLPSGSTSKGHCTAAAVAASPAPSQVPDASPALLTMTPRVIPMAEAWGDVPVHSIATDLGHDRRFSFAGAATSDGEWLIGASQPKGFSVEGKVTWGPSDAVLVRVSDGKVHKMAKLTSPLSQLVFAASDGPWVVWMESDDNPYGYDWRLRLYDRDTGTTRELAHAPHKDGGVVEGPWPVPSMSGNLIVWGQAIGPLTGDDPLHNAVVRQEDLRTRTITTVADHAGLPAISWPWMAWGVDEGTGGYTLVTDLESGQQERLDTAFHTLVLDGASAAWNTPDYHAMCLVDDLASGTVARPIVADPDVTYEWLTMNDRVVGYAQQSLHGELGSEPTQVYDRQLDALVDLPVVVGFSDTFAVGPLVVWQTPTKHWDDYPDLIRVVDTRDISQ